MPIDPTPSQTPPPHGTLKLPASRRWRPVVTAVALAAAFTAGQAWALALGRLAVQSQLGEPLRAQIDLPRASEEELSTLSIGIAPTDRFQAANMAFNPLLNSVSFDIERLASGEARVRLSSVRAMTEPFLDLVVQAQWANGQLVRGYTLLFDPPNLKPAPVPLLPAAAAPAPVVVGTEPARPVTADAAGGPRVSPPRAPATAAVTVRRGDTAGAIALANKPAGVSLDQMLIALLRANPRAFVGYNVNRLKAGVVLDMPDAASAEAVNPIEARQMLSAQSRDFNEYRRRLAGNAPLQDQAGTGRAATGQVQAEITDQQATPTGQDRLTLSKGETGGKADQVTQERQRAAQDARTAELSRNTQELTQLQEAAETVATEGNPEAPVPTPSTTTPPVIAAVPGPQVETPVAAPAEASPDAAPPPPAAPAGTPPKPSAGFVSSLLDNPLVLPAAGGLAVLLGALALWRLRKRGQAANAEAPEDDAQDSDYNAQGVSIDTSADEGTSSMMYSPSQLDAGGDVDPVAEADVYLAYGRDRQAEEILLEALRLHPDRMAVRLKLLEIYAQRSDVVAFNTSALEVHDLTGGTGPDWEQVRDTGMMVDPENPLYAGAATAEAFPEQPEPETETPLDEGPASLPADVDLGFGQANAQEEPTPLDLEESRAAAEPENAFDLDLDASAPPLAAEPPAATDEPGMDLDFDISQPAEVPPSTPPAPDDAGLDFDLDLNELGAPEPPVAAAPQPLPPEVQDLSLDLDAFEQPDAAPQPPAESGPSAFDAMDSLEVDEGLSDADPLETKLSLAREFEAIGDTDGARSLAEEVAADASGELQERARAFLAQLA